MKPIFFLLLSAYTSLASVTLFDFENEQERQAAPRMIRSDRTLGVTNVFASSGSYSLHFQTKPWRKGMDEWPSFTLNCNMHDWSKYDRISIDMVNLSAKSDLLDAYFSEAEGRVQNGLFAQTTLPAFGYRQWIIPLKNWPKTANAQRIARIHLYATRPIGINLFLDRIVLLKQGEKSPSPANTLLERLLPFSIKKIADFETHLSALYHKAQEICTTPSMKKECDYQFQNLTNRLSDIKAPIEKGTLTVETMKNLEEEIDDVKKWEVRFFSFLNFWRTCEQAGLPTDGMLVGQATSMEQVMPRNAAYHVRPADKVTVRLARNEREGVQILVTPTQGTLKHVKVSVTELRASPRPLFSSKTFPRENVSCEVMGYVKTSQTPPYKVDTRISCSTNKNAVLKNPFVGWWPNPILNFLDTVDIREGDIQSFWLRVNCPAGQQAGTYEGKIRISSENARTVEIPFRVRVNDFDIGRGSPLPLALTFHPEVNPVSQDKSVLAKAAKDPDFPVNAWKAHETEWADFLADYRITINSLYHRSMPPYAILNRLQAQGRLGIFNLGYWGYWENEKDGEKKWRERTLPKLQASYRAARENGMAGKAYLYGCDEVSTNYFKNIRKAISILKKEFPGVPIVTTAYDQTYGVDSPLSDIDIFCPLTPKFVPEQAEKARKEGRHVWWYICCGPHAPYANMFIECPAIESRMLMGPMTARMRPEGFLYYEITIWNSLKPITSGPFTDWNARSWTTYNGDGAWTCVGPGGKPLPTLRLENFRDGLEDFAYVLCLEEKLRARAGRGDDSWAKDARAMLRVPQELMYDMKTYSRDPKVLYAWRDRMADLIEAAE